MNDNLLQKFVLKWEPCQTEGVCKVNPFWLDFEEVLISDGQAHVLFFDDFLSLVSPGSDTNDFILASSTFTPCLPLNIHGIWNDFSGCIFG